MGIEYASPKERQEALEEAIALIRGLWGDQPFNFAGRYYRATDAHVPPPYQSPEPPLILAGGGEKVTLRQVARLADVANFGPGPAGDVDSPERARHKHEVLRGHCQAAGRSYDDILRSLFNHWVMIAPTEPEVRAKVHRYFPNGLDEFWGKYLVAGTPQQIVDLFQSYVDTGTQHFVCQVLDAEDFETFELIMSAVSPALNAK